MAPMNPPLPPNITSQQGAMSPVQQYVNGIAGVVAPEVQQFNPAMFALQKLTDAAAAVMEAAKVLVNYKPSALGIIKIMSEAGTTLMTELQQDVQMAQPAPGVDQLPAGEPQAQTDVQGIALG